MDYIKLPLIDNPVSVFSICQAHQQLESDYNVGGILKERPSNQRRNGSTGFQLHRMKFSSGMWWVDIDNPEDGEYPADTEVREIYCHNVLKLGLPISTELANTMSKMFIAEYLMQHENYRKACNRVG